MWLYRERLNYYEKLRRSIYEILRDALPNDDDAASFDVIVALNVWHRFLKTKDSLDRVRRFLARAKPRLLFLQHDDRDVPGAERSVCGHTAEELARLIVKDSPMDSWTIVGKSTDGRPLYRLYR